MITNFGFSATATSPGDITGIGGSILADRWIRRVCRWLIDRLTARPYCRWRSRLVDRLLNAIEGGCDRG